jgi:hypothetical protein
VMAIYIYLAVGCGFIGIALTFIVVFGCQYLGIDISRNLWVIAIPITIAVALNITLIELYSKYKKK